MKRPKALAGVLPAIIASAALAGQPDSKTPAIAPGPAASATVVANAATASADKVYPPLPSLTMLPAGSDDDGSPPAAPATRTSSRKRNASATIRKPDMPAVRMVVSDASHGYLDTVEHQLDQALLK
jgi:hypothetical protein